MVKIVAPDTLESMLNVFLIPLSAAIVRIQYSV